jgi:hypothetical protein
MSGYTSTTDATREQLMDALKERDERIEELEAALETQRRNDQNFKNAYYDRAVKAESEVERLRAAYRYAQEHYLDDISIDEALAAVQEEPK